jgi:uncharacterized membrane protein
MSSFVKHQAPAKTPVTLAIFIGIVWAGLLAAIWFAYRGGAEPGGFLHFIARFHVLIVHLPIGLIFLALIMEVLGYFTAFSHLRTSLPFVLWLSFLSGVGATVVGYLLMTLEEFSGRAMDLHLYFGLAVVVFTLVGLVFAVKGKRILSGLGTALAAFATAASGHFGGAMVHEPDYLTEFAPPALKPALLVGLGGKEEPAPEVAGETPAVPEKPIGERLVYEDFVVPILDKTCNECHNENKIKGKLRMDTHELLLAGAEGSDYPTVVPGKADDSELIVRVLLPEDDDEFMPPQGEPLKPAEVELLKLWINAGAKVETTVAQLGTDPAIAELANEVAAIHSGKNENAATAEAAAAPSLWDSLPEDEKTARLAEVNEAAEKYHFSVMPISAEDDRLRVNVINAAKDFGDDQLKLLEPVAERIVWLDLARSQVTDDGMKTVRLMRDLERLHLENTAITDKGIAELASLAKLEYINLYGTKVGNGIFETFAKLPALKKAYLWQTAVDPAEAKAFERSVNLEINTGVDLAEPPAAPAAETTPPAAKPEAPKKAEEKKPEAPKPAAPQATPAKPAAGPTVPAKPAPAPAKPAETKPEPAKPATPAAPVPAPAPAKADAPKPAAPNPAATPADAPKPAKPASVANPEPAKPAAPAAPPAPKAP